MHLTPETYGLTGKPHRNLAVPPLFLYVRTRVFHRMQSHKNLLHGFRGFADLARDAQFKYNPLNRTLIIFLNVGKPKLRHYKGQHDKKPQRPKVPHYGESKKKLKYLCRIITHTFIII